MIVLKIHFITIKFCENEELETAKKEVFSIFENSELIEALNIFFSDFKLEYGKISNVKVPNINENIYCDKILKALELSKKFQKNIILRNDIDFIDHTTSSS